MWTISSLKKYSPNIIKIIAKLYTKNHTFIKVAGQLSEKSTISTGIRYEDSLSSALFKIIMDETITEVKRVGRGYRMGDEKMKVICYADDVELIVEAPF